MRISIIHRNGAIRSIAKRARKSRRRHHLRASHDERRSDLGRRRNERITIIVRLPWTSIGLGVAPKVNVTSKLDFALLLTCRAGGADGRGRARSYNSATVAKDATAKFFVFVVVVVFVFVLFLLWLFLLRWLLWLLLHSA